MRAYLYGYIIQLRAQKIKRARKNILLAQLTGGTGGAFVFKHLWHRRRQAALARGKTHAKLNTGTCYSGIFEGKA